MDFLKALLSKNASGFCSSFTLYTYATEGSHEKLNKFKLGFYDGALIGLWISLAELEKNMEFKQKVELMPLSLDTAVGELTLDDFKQFIIPRIKN